MVLVLSEKFCSVRKKSLDICSPLEIEDYAVQPCAEVSPPKWHLGHTSWFFEEMILVPYLKNYKRFDDGLSVVFNSYYKGAGKHWLQSDRGQLSRPTVDKVCAYRKHVDDNVSKLLEDTEREERVDFLIEAGLHHEQQHQELLYMDIKYILGANPELPKYSNSNHAAASLTETEWFKINEGVYEIGFQGDEFSYDNERPKHKTYIHSSEICSKLVTNGEFLEFINNEGYKRPELWLSLGWDWINNNSIERPLYWHKENTENYEFTLHGLEKLDPHAPVIHISYFEADAFARWAKCRLPTEPELETFERENLLDETEVDPLLLQPKFSNKKSGQAWCWTSTHYSPYPGFEAFKGTLGEYNEKFMCNQFILRGGCITTPKGHYRESYRNFYQPHQRWMFSGLRLARNY